MNPQRIAISAVFFVNGLVMGGWIAQLPLIKEQFMVTESGIGILIMALAGGSVLSMLTLGARLDTTGTTPVIAVAVAILTVSLGSIGFIGNFYLLLVVLFFAGLANGIMDVAMNAQGTVVEGRAGKAIMSSLHACWSLGGMVGGAVTALMLNAGLDERWIWPAIIFFMLVISIIAYSHLLRPENEDLEPGEGGLALPVGPVALIAWLTLFAFVAEGVMYDWGTIYLTQERSFSPALAAYAFTLFAVGMTLSRFVGDFAVDRYGRRPILKYGALISFLTYGTILLVSNIYLLMALYALLGLTLANLVPIFFALAGRLPGGGRGKAIAAMSTMGYGGGLFMPASIGFLSQATGLKLAMLLGVSGLIAIVFLAYRLDKRRP